MVLTFTFDNFFCIKSNILTGLLIITVNGTNRIIKIVGGIIVCLIVLVYNQIAHVIIEIIWIILICRSNMCVLKNIAISINFMNIICSKLSN